MDTHIKQCRICLDNSLQFMSLDSCSVNYPHRSLRDNFNFCTHLNALKDDLLPNEICKACFKDLNSAVDFVQRAYDADVELRQRLGLLDEFVAPAASKSELIEVKQEIIEEYDSAVLSDQSTDDNQNKDYEGSESVCADSNKRTLTKVDEDEDYLPPNAKVARRNKEENEKFLSNSMCSICGEAFKEGQCQSHINKHEAQAVNNKTPFKLIESRHGKAKIIVDEFVLLKNRIHNDLYFWQCKLRRKNLGGCNAQAITKIVNGTHHLQIHTIHNHLADKRDSEKLERLKIREPAQKRSCVTKRNKSRSDSTDQQPNGHDGTVWHFGSNTKLILYDPTQPVHARQTKKDFVCYLCGETLLNSHSFKAHVARHAIDMQLANTEPCKLIQSQKGSPLLAYQGYIFHKNRSTNGLCYWQCKLSREQLGGCKSRITTHIVNGQHHLKTHTPHNHLPKDREVEKVEAMAEIKKIAKTTQDPTMQILDEVKSQLGCDENPEMPSFDLIQKIVKRARQSEQMSSSSVKVEPSDCELKINGYQLSTQELLVRPEQLPSEKIEVDQKRDLTELVALQEPCQNIEGFCDTFDSNVRTELPSQTYA